MSHMRDVRCVTWKKAKKPMREQWPDARRQRQVQKWRGIAPFWRLTVLSRNGKHWLVLRWVTALRWKSWKRHILNLSYSRPKECGRR